MGSYQGAGGFIGETIMLTQLLVAHADETKQEAIAVFADLEKAFDRCSWDFLIPALKELGFDDSFIRYIKLIYSYESAPQRRLHINGYLSDPFALNCSVAQGCPLSALLFLVVTEPICRLLKTDKTLKGVTVGDNRFVISQYADDTVFFMNKDDTSKFEAHIQTWCEGTGMQENKSKREVLPLGALRGNRQDRPRGVAPRDKYVEDGTPVKKKTYSPGFDPYLVHSAKEAVGCSRDSPTGLDRGTREYPIRRWRQSPLYALGATQYMERERRGSRRRRSIALVNHPPLARIGEGRLVL